MAIHWLTTLPNPNRPHSNAADDGQRGWRTHAVVAPEKATFAEIRLYRAACGMRPSHGWGLDMFIERRCAKCEKKLGLQPSPENVASAEIRRELRAGGLRSRG